MTYESGPVLAKLLWLSGCCSQEDSHALAYSLLTVLKEKGWSLVPTPEVYF